MFSSTALLVASSLLPAAYGLGPLYALCAYAKLDGPAREIVRSLDGGQTWTAITRTLVRFTRFFDMDLIRTTGPAGETLDTLVVGTRFGLQRLINANDVAVAGDPAPFATWQALGAKYQQGYQANEQQFTEADTKH